MAPPNERSSYRAILEHLVSHDVEFLVVGGIAAVLHGVPIVTFDLDTLHRRTPENVARLLAALDELNATYRTDSRGLKPTASHLSGPGHLLLRTSLGVVDVLGSVGRGLSYDDVVADSELLDLDGLSVRVLGLKTLLRLKEELGREKDRMTAEILRRMLSDPPDDS